MGCLDITRTAHPSRDWFAPFVCAAKVNCEGPLGMQESMS